MKRVIALLVACLMGVTVLSPPAEASTSSVQWAERDTKMGARPASSVICIANGIANYPTEYVLEKWNRSGYALALTVRNSCTGYSVTNRMTVTLYRDDNTPNCGKFTNLGRQWDAVQGKYIWNQNPVVWLNTNPYCAANDTIWAHNMAMFTGVILGLDYSTCDCNEVMSTSTHSVNTVKYVTLLDIQHMGAVYGLAA